MKKVFYGIGFCASVVLAVLCLVFCLIAVFSGRVDGLLVREPVTVSASPTDASRTQYVLQAGGILFNEGDQTVTVEAIKLTVRHKNTTEVRELEGFSIEARTAREIFYEWSGETPYDNVDALELVIDGETVRLSNRAPSLLSPDALILLVFTVLFSFLGVFFAKKSYYIYQKKKMEPTEA